jgi:hypothetical protein
MQIYEQMTKLRWMRKGFESRLNAYNVHAQMEKAIVEDAGINTPFSFVFIENVAEGAVLALSRTISPTGLPGELAKTVGFYQDQIIDFRVKLHTSRSSRKPDGRPCSVAITSPDEQMLKLASICEKNGFEIIEQRVLDDCSMFIRKGKQKGFNLAGCTLLVKAKITSPITFEQTFAFGLGSKKSFGFGMIIPLTGDTK